MPGFASRRSTVLGRPSPAPPPPQSIAACYDAAHRLPTTQLSQCLQCPQHGVSLLHVIHLRSTACAAWILVASPALRGTRHPRRMRWPMPRSWEISNSDRYTGTRTRRWPCSTSTSRHPSGDVLPYSGRITLAARLLKTRLGSSRWRCR